MSKPKLAGVARFAHLLGINPRASEPENGDDDAPERLDGESDEDYAKRCEEEKAKKAKKAEEDKNSEGDGPDDTGEAGDDDRKDKASRKSERARCAAIFGSKAAAARPDMAAHLAFETDMSAEDSIKMLGAIAAGQPKPNGLSSRMASVAVPVVGANGGPGAPDVTTAAGASAVAANAIIAAARRASGEKA